jgi:hypothetical protein
MLCSVASQANIWVSSDQLTYSEATSGRAYSGQGVSAPIWDGTRFITTTSPIMTSVDGANWIYRFDRQFGLNGVAFGSASARYVHVGRTNTGAARFFYGDNLIDWVETTVPNSYLATSGGNGGAILSLAGGPDGFVAVSQALGALVSPDGIAWTHYPGTTGPHRVRYLNGKFYGVAPYDNGGNNNKLYERAQGDVAWTTYSIPASVRLGDVGYANGVYAVSESLGNRVWVSTDKTTWTMNTVPATVPNLHSIVASGSAFIAVGVDASASNTTASALTGVMSSGNLTWTSKTIVGSNVEMVDVVIANGKTVIAGFRSTTDTVRVSIIGSSGGTVPGISLPTANGGNVSFSAIPNAGNAITGVSGCGAMFSGTTVTTGPVTVACTVTVTFGVAPVACTLDIDRDGAVLPATDGLLILRRMLTLTDEPLRANAYNPSGTRLVAADMAALIDPMIATKTLDIDGNGSVTAATDGLILLRALLGFSGATVTDGALGTGTLSRGNWALIRPYLATVCGIPNLAP